MGSEKVKYLTFFNTISIVVLVLLLVFYLVNLLFDYAPSYVFNRTDLFNLIEIIIQFILTFGVILAYLAYKKQSNWDKKKGLELSLKIQKKQDENLILFKISVTNKTTDNIEIMTAYLEISDHETGKLIHKFPLNYFNTENIQVGNETLRYVFPCNLSDYKSTDKIWDVRFKITPKKGLYRIVHSSFKGTFSEIRHYNLQ